MIDVGKKAETERMARACGSVRMSPEVAKRIQEGKIVKGDVLATARLAAITAAKMTPSILPLCHPVRLTAVEASLHLVLPDRVEIEVAVRGFDRTGFEMEALTGVAGAALTVYDMVKSLDPSVSVESMRLQEKSGGKSGHWTAPR